MMADIHDTGPVRSDGCMHVLERDCWCRPVVLRGISDDGHTVVRHNPEATADADLRPVADHVVVHHTSERTTFYVNGRRVDAPPESWHAAASPE